MSDQVEMDISQVLNGTGLPAVPTPADYRDAAGPPAATRMAADSIAAVDAAVETVVAQHYRAVENLEDMTRQARENVDRLAEKLRGYTKGFTGHLGEFFVYAQKASDLADAQSQEFEDRISKAMYTRAGETN